MISFIDVYLSQLILIMYLGLLVSNTPIWIWQNRNRKRNQKLYLVVRRKKAGAFQAIGKL